MQHLAEVTGEAKYNEYATNFCDFHINGAPFVNYQVKTLRAVNSANSRIFIFAAARFYAGPGLALYL
jgi:unsaturated rhamnogalacturonyl hydrolase